MADKEHLGKGWRFPVAINLTGGVATSSLDESVRQSIFVILGTAPGERVGRAEFGCLIHNLVFAPCTPMTGALAEHYIEEALLKFEPRIQAVQCAASPNADDASRLDIDITYQLRGENHARNMVYPFYLEQDDEV